MRVLLPSARGFVPMFFPSMMAYELWQCPDNVSPFGWNFLLWFGFFRPTTPGHLPWIFNKKKTKRTRLHNRIQRLGGQFGSAESVTNSWCHALQGHGWKWFGSQNLTYTTVVLEHSLDNSLIHQSAVSGHEKNSKNYDSVFASKFEHLGFSIYLHGWINGCFTVL